DLVLVEFSAHGSQRVVRVETGEVEGLPCPLAFVQSALVADTCQSRANLLMDRVRQGRSLKRVHKRRDGVIRKVKEVARVEVFACLSLNLALDVLLDDERIHVEKRKRDGEAKGSDQHGERKDALPAEDFENDGGDEQKTDPDEKD